MIPFTKYQGTGNDFIMIDERNLPKTSLSTESIKNLCNRRFGVGADGLIVIRKDERLDFYVDYFNADGSQSFCGNGARCSVKFAQEIGLIGNTCNFNAIDGAHEATINENGDVKLLMSPVNQVDEEGNQSYVTDTGSPHYIRFVENIEAIDIVDFGKSIRFSERYKQLGINVNTAQIKDNFILVKTYERGVEDETYSCGTGVTAVALAAALNNEKIKGCTAIETKGGSLRVHWEKTAYGFENIYLEGPANKVYEGHVEI